MDPAGVQAARQSSIGEKKRRIRSPTEQQQPAPARVCTCITMCGNQRQKELLFSPIGNRTGWITAQ